MAKAGATFKLFFDTPSVKKALDKAERNVLARQGRYVQRVARSSIKNPPRAKLKDMTAEERQNFHIRTEYARRAGRPLPKRPRTWVSSPPGTPPYSRSGLLKRLLFFGYDAAARSVVIGPVAAGPRTADALEYGGTVREGRRNIKIRPRPTMRLAYEKSKVRLTSMWRDSVK